MACEHYWSVTPFDVRREPVRDARGTVGLRFGPMSQSPPPPPPPPSPPPPPAGASSPAGSLAPVGAVIPPAWKRILARFLDWLIVTLVFGSILSGLILNSDDDAAIAGVGGDASFGKLYLISLLSAAVWFVWDAVCTKQFGGTPMKLAFGMKVVQQGSGEPVQWGHAIIRCTMHRLHDRLFAVAENLVQLARLLAAAFVDPVEFARVAAGKIVKLEIFVIAEGKTALGLFFELIRRQLKIVIPESDFSGLQVVTA